MLAHHFPLLPGTVLTNHPTQIISSEASVLPITSATKEVNRGKKTCDRCFTSLWLEMHHICLQNAENEKYKHTHTHTQKPFNSWSLNPILLVPIKGQEKCFHSLPYTHNYYRELSEVIQYKARLRLIMAKPVLFLLAAPALMLTQGLRNQFNLPELICDITFY